MAAVPESTSPLPSSTSTVFDRLGRLVGHGSGVHRPRPPSLRSREAVAQFGFDADLEHVCTTHDMTP